MKGNGRGAEYSPGIRAHQGPLLNTCIELQSVRGGRGEDTDCKEVGKSEQGSYLAFKSLSY